MPKQTFFNLSEEKRKKIENSSIKEFAEFGFHGARLNNIVLNAGIAKGSFYQYFNNLEDLFIYLIKSTSNLKMDIIHKVLKENKDADLFTKFAEIQRAGITYYNSLSKDMVRLFEQVNTSHILNNDELKKWITELEELEYYPLVDEAIASGEIADDRDFAYVLLSNTGKMLSKYVQIKKKSTLIRDIFSNEEIVDEAIIKFVDLLKVGLKS